MHLTCRPADEATCGENPSPAKRLLYHFTVPASAEEFQFRRIEPGIETLPSSFSLPRHRHLQAYATVVLAGSFEESGYAGRICAAAGDVLIHPTLDCHANQMISAGVKLLRLHWPEGGLFGGLYRLTDVDEIARIAERDVRAAAMFLESVVSKSLRQSPGIKNDWPDLLLSALVTNATKEIGTWAETNGLARETVSRGFTMAYDITPTVFRAEWRARSAWLRIARGSDCLSQIATETGFADQAHMTRWIRRITGAPPSAWRPQWWKQKSDRRSGEICL
jgi:AraC-like DNA-binding protein